jgi:hypothetical protein
MKFSRLNITVEGQTELGFAKQVLAPHLLGFGWIVQCRALKSGKKRGGYTTYAKARADIIRWMKDEPTAWHTTMLDLYGLSSDFPGYDDVIRLSGHEKVERLENAFKKDIENDRFIPYIQLHEFEALLFSDPEYMEEFLTLDFSFKEGAFQKILDQFNGDPESIDDHPQTAPSRRIATICPAYKKVFHGELIAEAIGLEKIREKCRHFNEWLNNLEEIGGKIGRQFQL